MVMADLQTILH